MELHNMVRHDGTSPHPVAQTPKSRYISSKEELINDYPDHFEGIWQISWNLQDTLKNLVIHPQQKWPIAMHPKLKINLIRWNRMA